jgi:MoxR-like ATPase
MNNNQSVLDQSTSSASVERAVGEIHERYQELKKQLALDIVGMDDITELLMIGILCRGHCILQGMPGLAKTLLISRLGALISLSFRRIQFTPDLMPADITGGEVMDENKATGAREFRFVKGPLFTNLVLADEINRTPPKTQSALLEAMEERQLSIAGKTYALPEPFFVLATQNPIEVEGTYTLPEAQLDRFLFKIKVKYPSREDEFEICRRQTTDYATAPEQVFDGARVIQMQSTVRKVIVSQHVYAAAIDLARWTRPEESRLPSDLQKMVKWGAGPRASINLLKAAQARAILHRRVHATTEDIAQVAAPILRHRIVPTFNAEAAGIDTDVIVMRMLQELKLGG